jgi:hypothetical protein
MGISAWVRSMLRKPRREADQILDKRIPQASKASITTIFMRRMICGKSIKKASTFSHNR